MSSIILFFVLLFTADTLIKIAYFIKIYYRPSLQYQKSNVVSVVPTSEVLVCHIYVTYCLC